MSCIVKYIQYIHIPKSRLTNFVEISVFKKKFNGRSEYMWYVPAFGLTLKMTSNEQELKTLHDLHFYL